MVIRTTKVRQGEPGPLSFVYYTTIGYPAMAFCILGFFSMDRLSSGRSQASKPRLVAKFRTWLLSQVFFSMAR
jgi:hypothetical protein